MNRREFLKRLGVLAGAVPLAACAADQTNQTTQQSQSAANGKATLKVIQQKHFIAGYDDWFDNVFAKQWGEQNGVNVEVTHIGFGDLFTAATGIAATQTGADIHAFPSPPMAFEDEVVDLSDIGQALEAEYGEMLPLAKNSILNPETGKWIGISDHFVPLVSNWRSDLWEAAEAGSAPDTWEDVLRVGRILKKNGHPIGVGMSFDLDSNIVLNGLLNAYGAVLQDEKGIIAINSSQTVDALKLGGALFRETMQPEILAWNASSNNQFMLSGKGSMVMNAVSITRVSEKSDPALANRINISKPPSGPAQGKTPANVTSVYTIWKFSKHIDLAKQFIKDLIAESSAAFQHAELYNYPAFPGAVSGLKQAYEAEPKYTFLSTAPDWVCNVGYPAFANAVTNEIFDNYLVPKAFSLVAMKTLSAEDGAKWLGTEANKLLEQWRIRNNSRGL